MEGESTGKRREGVVVRVREGKRGRGREREGEGEVWDAGRDNRLSLSLSPDET